VKVGNEPLWLWVGFGLVGLAFAGLQSGRAAGNIWLIVVCAVPLAVVSLVAAAFVVVLVAALTQQSTWVRRRRHSREIERSRRACLPWGDARRRVVRRRRLGRWITPTLPARYRC